MKKLKRNVWRTETHALKTARTINAPEIDQETGLTCYVGQLESMDWNISGLRHSNLIACSQI